MGIDLSKPKNGVLNPMPILAHKPCKCSKPGWLGRWFDGVIVGSLYRCERCGQVWKWSMAKQTIDISVDGERLIQGDCKMWVHGSFDDWTALGGRE